MKRTIIGGILSLVGSIWSLGIIICAGNNPVNTWDTALGRFWSTVIDMHLMFPFVISAIIAAFGIGVLLIELFSKEK